MARARTNTTQPAVAPTAISSTSPDATNKTSAAIGNNKGKSLLPQVLIRPQTDLHPKSRTFIRDVVEILYEKVFLNGEDTLRLAKEVEAATKRAGDSTTPATSIDDDGKWLQEALMPEQAIQPSYDSDQDARQYMKRLQSKQKHQLYVDWVRNVLDSRYGGGWHVLFGKDMGFAMRYRKGSLGMFSIGNAVRVIVYKSGPEGTALHNNRLVCTRPPEVKAAAYSLTDKDCPKLQIVGWYGYCAEEWEDEEVGGAGMLTHGEKEQEEAREEEARDGKEALQPHEPRAAGGATEGNDPTTAIQIKRKEQILEFARSRKRFEPVIDALTKAVPFEASDSAVFARSLRYQLTKNAVFEDLEKEKKNAGEGASSASSTNTATSNLTVENIHCKESSQRDLLPEEGDIKQASRTASGEAEITSASTTSPSLTVCQPKADSSWHCYIGSDYAVSTAVTAENQITAMYKKKRVIVFQHCSPDDPQSFSPVALAKTVFSDGQMLMKILPYLCLFLLGIWYCSRKILCVDRESLAGGALAADGTGHAEAVDRSEASAENLTDTAVGPKLTVHPNVEAYTGQDFGFLVDTALCRPDLEKSGIMTYVAGLFIAMMVARSVSGKMGGGGGGKR
ncbi:unnamed protein product [Amoebophrya sp. A120]|nr:unnamed protein product [Amoebophrya sp. A120]|eukprot:GSA120T00017267001.1